jgi:hypothetical protein
MTDFKLINLGIYHEHLKTQIETLTNERKLEKDPYKQWMIEEKKTLIINLLEDYDRLIMRQ